MTPSQKGTVKYFLVVSLLFLLQIVMGIVTAHYGVEGGGFYLNNKAVSDVKANLTAASLATGSAMVLRHGKKHPHLVKVQ